MTGFYKHIALLACFLGIVPLQAALVRVPADKPTIQEAINSASNGDTVVVSPGTYYENILFRGKNIVVTSRFYETGDLGFIQSTVLNGSQPIHSDTSSCVLIINGEDSTAVLQGFTITGGQGTKWADEHGAGTYREGGGILIEQSAPTIRYNLIVNNQAVNTSGVTSAGGGGIRAGDGNPKILNNVVASNKGRYGAGIVLNFTGATLRNNILTKNSGCQDYGGGALWMNNNGSMGKTIENNTIAGNSVLGVYVWAGSSVMRNSILWGNTSPQIAAHSGGLSVTYSDVQGGWSGTGNINQDPLFADSTELLRTGSPCIDAGDTNAVYNDLADPLSPGNAHSPSRGGLKNDIGAYGGPGAGMLPLFGVSTGIISSGINLPMNYRLEQNYPNPFNPSTVISYQLAGQSHVTLRVYDLLGREVAVLVNEVKSAGNYTATFNASNFPSGVYFYRLTANAVSSGQAGNFSSVKKMLMLK